MARAGFGVKVVESPEVKITIRALKGTKLATPMRRELRTVVDHAVQALKADIRQLPSSADLESINAKRTHTGTLRDEIANAVQKIFKASQRKAMFGVTVSPRKMPNIEANLPWYFDGLGRWRHPVFKNRKVWVQQHPQVSFWFEGSLTRMKAQTEIVLSRIIREYERKVN